jgi:hypothetical protein
MLSSGLDRGDVDGLRMQQGYRLVGRVLRHFHHLLLLLQSNGHRQHPGLLLGLP